MQAQSQPVTVVITCEIKAEKLELAKRELADVIQVVMREEPACHGIVVHDDPRNPRRLLIVERWESEEIFNGPHMQMPHMKAFLTKAQDFLAGPADFAFWREVSAVEAKR